MASASTNPTNDTGVAGDTNTTSAPKPLGYQAWGFYSPTQIEDEFPRYPTASNMEDAYGEIFINSESNAVVASEIFFTEQYGGKYTDAVPVGLLVSRVGSATRGDLFLTKTRVAMVPYIAPGCFATYGDEVPPTTEQKDAKPLWGLYSTKQLCRHIDDKSRMIMLRYHPNKGSVYSTPSGGEVTVSTVTTNFMDIYFTDMILVGRVVDWKRKATGDDPVPSIVNGKVIIGPVDAVPSLEECTADCCAAPDGDDGGDMPPLEDIHDGDDVPETN